MNGIRWLQLHSVRDTRGALTAVEGAPELPFDIKRIFYMHDVAPGADRGGHAHRDTDQLAIAVHGTVSIVLSDGSMDTRVVLDRPEWGVLLPRMTWTRLREFSPGAVCLVLASTHYDMSKSIRTWPEYLSERGLPARAEPLDAPLLARPVA